MRDLAEVDYDQLKARCAELNEQLEAPFPVVGQAKDVLVTQFAKNVEKLTEEQLDMKELEEVINFYNMLFADEAAPGESSETETSPGEEESAGSPEEGATTGEEEASGGDGDQKPEKKKRRGPVPYTTFEELQKWLGEQETPTSAMDRLLLEGGKLPEIVEKFKSIAEQAGYKGFKTPSSVKSHVQYREKKGWKYDYQGEGDDQVVRLIGYER